MKNFRKKIFKKIFPTFLIISLIFSQAFSVHAQMSAEVSGAKISANGDTWVANKRVEHISKTLKSIFFPFSYSGLNIFIDSHQKEPRGQIRGKEMKLSAQVVADAEFLKLFTHELGHFIDIYVLRATQNSSDPSGEFYKISWKGPKTKHASAKMASFVSGYGATNQYEDFAEAFVWYVFHNEKFLDEAMKNDDLRLKYLFFADYVFKNGEFQ